MKMAKVISLIIVCLFLNIYPPQVNAQGKSPNIIIILADDLGYGDLGCYGSAYIKTPHIDSLANAGMRFTDFYAGSTVCAPSRATLMTGQHTGHTFIRGNGEVPLPEADSILPQYLHKAGYVNGMVGKWGLGQKGTTGEPGKKGWDFFSGHLHHVEGHYQHPDSAWQMINGQCQKIKIPEEKFANEWFKDEAIRFLNLNHTQPFFLYVSFTLPHAELVVPDNFLEEYINQDSASLFAPEIEHRSGQHYGPQKYPRAAYAAMVSQLDAYVGELMVALKKLKLSDNTIIIFTSDNGTHAEGGRTRKDVQYFNSSGNLRGIKRDLYEGGIRVPFIVNWRNKVKGGRINKFTGAFWDILPTLTDAAGLNKKFTTDGLSFLPALKGRKQKQHDFLYWEFYEGGFKQAIRQGYWKAIRYFREGLPYKTELYNLRTDSGETKDLATQNPQILALLQTEMDKTHQNSKHPLFKIK
jgi:arylsulfatase A-like enzyme